jgi:hypothetical protein
MYPYTLAASTLDLTGNTYVRPCVAAVGAYESCAREAQKAFVMGEAAAV